MNDISLRSFAEKEAEKAESLKAFSGLKLLHLKRSIAACLANIGKDGIFDEYTKHDVSHIDYMLDSLKNIIPEDTKVQMTPSDWLMITLAVYFHDLGMLVTKEEFDNRAKTGFGDYRDKVVSGYYGADYRDKIAAIGDLARQDRFIYQELVRQTHAERVKHWILDECHPTFSTEKAIVKEVKGLLEHVDPMFRRDLAYICESHHLDDLDDFSKYKVNQQYGPADEEVVNLQYAALLLRTADLLHITSDRTPSIELRLINPTDPISQEEWAKQGSVKSVRPQIKKNKEGILDPCLQKDTFEVIALFKDEKGFFGLIAYLNYVAKELKKNYKHNETAKHRFSTTFEYPWKEIDDSNIETENFEKNQFEFVLDQMRILDLLVGHTLYNDSTVVLRELAQNAIDASKLKKFELEAKNSCGGYEPALEIKWESSSRELTGGVHFS